MIDKFTKYNSLICKKIKSIKNKRLKKIFKALFLLIEFFKKIKIHLMN